MNAIGIDVYDCILNISPREYIQIKASSLPLHCLMVFSVTYIICKGPNLHA